MIVPANHKPKLIEATIQVIRLKDEKIPHKEPRKEVGDNQVVELFSSILIF